MSKDPIKLKTIFMGTSNFAAYIFQTLLNNNYNIISAYTQPDKKVGRNKELRESAVKIFAKEANIPIFTPDTLNEETIEQIRSLKPDLIIVVAYGKILPKAILDIPGFGCLNIHASLLPKFRGPSPIQNALMQGEKETGVSIILMSERVDEGDIISEDKIDIEKTDTYTDLSKKLAQLAASLLLKTLPAWVEGRIDPIPQDNDSATYCQLIERSDGKVNWTEEAEFIYNRFRAFYPWPGVYTFWSIDDQNIRLKLNKISFLNINPENLHHLGEVFQIGEKIGVQTTKGVVIIEEIQMEGKKNMTIYEFINGNNNFIGSILK